MRQVTERSKGTYLNQALSERRKKRTDINHRRYDSDVWSHRCHQLVKTTREAHKVSCVECPAEGQKRCVKVGGRAPCYADLTSIRSDYTIFHHF